MDSSNRKKHEHRRKLHRHVKRHSRKERAEKVRIKQQIRALRGVLPNSGKPDMVSVLSEVIDYVKLLQSQIHAIKMRNSLQDRVSAAGLQYLQHPQFATGPLEVPMALGNHQGMYFGNGSPGMGSYSDVPLLHPSTAHHYLSRTSTLPWQHQVPNFPMHVPQLHHPPMCLQQGPLSPCEFCSVSANAWTWPHRLHCLVPDQEAKAQEEESVTTMTRASTESS